ncbi:nucleophile aminohydrolase [Blastocladiella britannica]|nr:nucleophile aminohydrolase [Blastocladiella britannica]
MADPSMSSSAPFVEQPVPYASRRSAVYARKYMVASSQPLATHAGVRILEQGGNAADAAVAVAAALNVTEPGSCGVGGDMFCLFYSAKDGTVRPLPYLPRVRP